MLHFIKYCIFAPDMRSNWFKYLMLIGFLMIYINRGLFVATPGTETTNTNPASSNEVNSLLEIIIELAGGHNHIDEDGDSPESYNFAKTAQPVINPGQNLVAGMERPYTPANKLFLLIDEAMPSLYTYGTIDHPPEVA